jgi:SAM-dependent methyltransferase
MKEASKSNRYRKKEFAAKYLFGRVIDIGCGDDPVCPTAEPFDLAEGDANNVAALRPRNSYDTVYSSHCLEHMKDAPKALASWWELVKPGGHLIAVVPHEDLYEQGHWPSLYNGDHKATFRLDQEKSWSPVSYDLRKLGASLPCGEVVSAKIQDHGYDYSMKSFRRRNIPRVQGKVFRFAARVRKYGKLGDFLIYLANKAAYWVGAPVDQTLGGALAQIEIIVRKKA